MARSSTPVASPAVRSTVVLTPVPARAETTGPAQTHALPDTAPYGDGHYSVGDVLKYLTGDEA